MNKFFDYGFDNIKLSINLPKPIVSEHEGIKVVRDDFLDGGTKRRAFSFYIQSVDADEFVYASPRFGYAQLSLAYICKDLGKKATVFVPKGERYWLTNEAEKLGAKIIEVPLGYLRVINKAARDYVVSTSRAHLIPFGGDHPLIIQGIQKTALSLDIEPPKEVWTVMSSGVLSRGLQLAWPDAKVYGVKIGHGTTHKERGRAITFDSIYKFEQECKEPERPPFPSSLNYDAKCWSFIKEHASNGALFWNVGK